MFKLIIRKMIKNKWLVLSLIVGCLLAVSVVGAIPMYSDGILQRMLIKDFEREQEAKNTYPAFAKFEGVFSNIPNEDQKRDLYDHYDRNVEQRMAIDIPMEVVVGYRTVGTPNRIFLDQRDWSKLLEEIEAKKTFKTVSGKANTYGVDKLPEMVDLVQGDMYSPGLVRVKTDTYDGEVYEVVITSDAMQRNRYSLGTIYTLTVNKDEAEYILNYRIVGVVEVKEEMTPYFYMDYYGIFFDYDTFLNSALKERNMALNTCEWYYAYDYYQLQMKDSKSILDSLDSNYIWISENYGRLKQSLSFEATLTDYLTRAGKLSGLLLLLVIPVILMIGFYVSMIAQLIMEQEKNEIAMLESRGASRKQIFSIYLGESLIIGLISYIFGIIGAYYMTIIIGASNGFMEFVNRSAMDVGIGWKTLVYGGACALLFVIMILIPAYKASKFTIVEFKQGKGVFARKPFWQKFYLDLVLLVISSYALYNYNKFKEAISLTEGGQVDYLVFFAVTFFILGVSLVFMRIYPLIVDGIFRMGRRLWKPPLYAAFTYVARGGNMRQFIMIFLILALGVGIFNANSARTINENTTDLIKYENGPQIIINLGELGVSESGDVSDVADSSQKAESYEILSQFDGLYGITKVAVRTVEMGSESRKSQRLKEVKLLAIKPEEFGNVVWYRDDLYDTHINNYLNLMARYPEGVIVSTQLAEKLEIVPGDMMNIKTNDIEFEVPLLATVDYWPSYNRYVNVDDQGNGDEQELCVMHYDKLRASIGEFTSSVWLAKKEGVLDSELNEYLVDNEITVLNAIFTDFEVSEMKKDPMLHGMNGMLTLDFLVTMIICGAGFIIFWVLSIRQRVLQFGIFRAMGLKKKELISIIIWEQILISAVAIVMGILIGGITSELFVPLFQIVDISSERVIPYITAYERQDYIRIYAIVVTMLVIGISAITRFTSKIKMDQAVKLGED